MVTKVKKKKVALQTAEDQVFGVDLEVVQMMRTVVNMMDGKIHIMDYMV